ncbi:MAG: PQQ-like beta-propeller repeat protein [Planctomycetes bacterium]|jgi:outer membrane protein assembly factor BamB|nr:PQQ-like beta-propeller repeat protein [Planctomycetota bacterium]
MPPRASLIGAAALVCLLLVPIAPAQSNYEGLMAPPEPDWPQWRGPRRDGISEETGLRQSWPAAGPALLWKIDGLGMGWSCPIIVGERLYVTGDVGETLVIFALDHNGKVRWQAKNGSSWKTPYPGARACCAYSEGRLYHLNAHGRLACLEAETGRELWAVDILERFGGRNITWALSECLLVDGSRVIVTPGGNQALMAALDKRTGETVWTTEPLGTDRASHSSPILFRYGGRRLIANCSSAHGFGVDADTGKLLWTVPLTNPHGVNVATPIYGTGCLFFVTPYAERGRLYRLRPDAQSWAAEHAWTSPIDTVTGCGILLNGTLYGSGYREVKSWLAVDWQTGRTKCELKDLTTGAALYADQRLYVLDETGTVALLNPGPNGLEIVSRFRLVDARARDAWAHPVVHDARLYLRYHDTLWCYDVKDRR